MEEGGNGVQEIRIGVAAAWRGVAEGGGRTATVKGPKR